MAAKKALFDKKGMALTRAKLRAWWDGADFDPEAAMAEIEAKLAAEPVANDVSEDELFDELPYELPPRLQALGVLWGEDRVRPGDATADRLEPARIGLAPEGVLAVLGPGLAGVMEAVAAAHPGKIDVYEWREETFDALKHGLKKAKLDARITAARIDLEAHIFTPGAYDGLLSIDDFVYCGHPPHLAAQLFKSLKPGACAVIECYVGFNVPEIMTAFASSFAEPQIRAHGDILQALTDTGFALEADEDMTEDFLFTARAAFKQLGERLTAAGALEVAVARELAWETEAWRMRLQLLATRRLERRRFVVRRPADDQPANANAPAG